ncbi:MAG: alpha/beta fold hydrolase [Solirubrobacterales bacterium]|nr:alpha/beta fold hydrolase [Solirubrobacterales bacterium]
MRSRITLRRSCLTAVAAAAMLGLAAPGAGATSFSRIQGYDEPSTPSQYDKVGILKVGPKSAPNVLLLAPGTSAGASNFLPLSRDIVARTKRSNKTGSWQVWSIERRENLLEDQTRLNQYKSGDISSQDVFDYYLGWLSNGAINPHFTPLQDSTVPFARDWGMKVAVEDIHAVVRTARHAGERVVLGGHSLGGSIATAYATWDFSGTAGAKDLKGLVLIDGASRFGEPPTAQEAQASLDALDASPPFLDLLGLGFPWIAGAFNAVGSNEAREDPHSESIFQDWVLAPADLKPPVNADNEAQYGYALDTETGPANLALVQVHGGRLADSGDPRGWNDADELTPIQRVAAAFAGSGLEGLDGTSWYHPKRLSIDSGAVNNGVANDAQQVLDVDATHGGAVRMPIYAFGAALGDGRVLDSARNLAEQSGVPKRDLTLINRHGRYAHIDPLTAYPRNAFVKNLIPFLTETRAGIGKTHKK